MERGIKFTRQEETTKKYYFNDQTDILVGDGEEVKVGRKLATIKAPNGGVIKIRKATTKSR